MVKCKPLPSREILSPAPKTVQVLSTPFALKSYDVVAWLKPGSAGHVFFVGSQRVDVCPTAKGSNERRAGKRDAANNIIEAIRELVTGFVDTREVDAYWPGQTFGGLNLIHGRLL